MPFETTQDKGNKFEMLLNAHFGNGSAPLDLGNTFNTKAGIPTFSFSEHKPEATFG